MKRRREKNVLGNEKSMQRPEDTGAWFLGRPGRVHWS